MFRAGVLVLSVFWLPAWSACSARPRTPEEPASATGSTLRILGRTSRPLIALEHIARERGDRSGARLEISRRDTMTEVLAELEAKATSAPASYDLAVVPHRFLGQLVEAGVVAPLDPFSHQRRAALKGQRSVPSQDPEPPSQGQSAQEIRLVDGDTDFFAGWWRQTAW